MKTKISKRFLTIILGFLAFVCCAVSLALMSTKNEKITVSADTQVITSEKSYDGFSMKKGASIRIDEQSGIRFTVNVSKAAYESIQVDYPEYKSLTFYTLIARQSKVANGDMKNLTPDIGENVVIKIRATENQQPNGSADTAYNTALCDIPDTKYGETLMARGLAIVVDKNGVENRIYASSDDNVRSMRQVALATAVEDGTDDGLAKYFTAKNNADGEGATDEAAPATVEVNLPKLNENEKVEAVYYNGTQLTNTISDGVMTLTNAAVEMGTEGVIAEGDYELSLYTNEYNLYTAKLIRATKILETASDFSVFDISEPKKVEGYYVLGNDIEFDSTWAGNSHAGLVTVNPSSQGVERTGFFGTFDGRGYSVEMNSSGNGLFGNLFGTVKNVNFTFNETDEAEENYCFGYWASCNYVLQAKLENVNVVVNNFGAASQNGNNSAVISKRSSGFFTITDCTFEIRCVKSAMTKTTGLLVKRMEYWNADGTTFTYYFNGLKVKTNNETTPLMTMTETTDGFTVSKNYWAGNDGKTNDWATDIVLKDYTAYVSAAENTTCTGAVRDELDFGLEYKTVNEFSAYDGDFDFSFLADGEEIVSVMQGETVLTTDVANNKLMGVVPNITAMDDQKTVVYTGTDVFGNVSANPGTRKVNPVTVVISTNKAVYYVEVTAYTRVIKTAEQLSTFDVAWGNPFMTTRAESISQTALTTGENGGYYIDGYYLLGNDIEDLTWTPNKHAASGALNIAFMGVFDGNGHTLHVKAGAKGLFGWAFRACIKNTNFIFEEQSGTAGSVGLADRLGMGQWKGRCVVSNVSVTINNFGAGSEKGVYSAALVNRVDSQIAFENVKVNLNYADGFTATDKTTGLVILRAETFSTAVSITVTESAASGAPIATHYAAGKPETLTAKYWASNDGKTTDDGTILSGVTRSVTTVGQ